MAERSQAPRRGQWVRITERPKDAKPRSYEGPVCFAAGWESPDGPKHIGIGEDMRPQAFRVGLTGDDSIEPATWEVIVPAEPPNQAIWVIFHAKGKTSVYRRVDSPDRPDDTVRWFYPGSVVGATWEQVISRGYGRLLELGNG